jgi:hypothetical protein
VEGFRESRSGFACRWGTTSEPLRPNRYLQEEGSEPFIQKAFGQTRHRALPLIFGELAPKTNRKRRSAIHHIAKLRAF